MIDAEAARRIVLVRIGKTGDLIVSNFAIRKIRRAFPRAYILLVTLPRNRELLQYTTDVDRVFFFHKGLDLLRLVLALRKFRADLLMDFNDNPSSTSAFIARYGGAKTRVGFEFEKSRRFLTIPVRCPPRETTHITERLRKIPEAIGVSFEDDEIHPSMNIGERELREMKEHLAGVNPKGHPIIAVNVSAGHRSRYWQAEKWQKLLSTIKDAEKKTMFLMLHLPAEVDTAKTAAASLAPDRVIFPARSGFQHFAAYISQSDLLISPDTSAIHIACAFRVPVVGLYPAVEWNFQSWRPIGTIAETVRPTDGVVPDISYEEVLAAFLRIKSRLPMGIKRQLNG